jgi:hypothetical protein
MKDLCEQKQPNLHTPIDFGYDGTRVAYFTVFPAASGTQLQKFLKMRPPTIEWVLDFLGSLAQVLVNQHQQHKAHGLLRLDTVLVATGPFPEPNDFTVRLAGLLNAIDLLKGDNLPLSRFDALAADDVASFTSIAREAVAACYQQSKSTDPNQVPLLIPVAVQLLLDSLEAAQSQDQSSLDFFARAIGLLAQARREVGGLDTSYLTLTKTAVVKLFEFGLIQIDPDQNPGHAWREAAQFVQSEVERGTYGWADPAAASDENKSPYALVTPQLRLRCSPAEDDSCIRIRTINWVDPAALAREREDALSVDATLRVTANLRAPEGASCSRVLAQIDQHTAKRRTQAAEQSPLADYRSGGSCSTHSLEGCANLVWAIPR